MRNLTNRTHRDAWVTFAAAALQTHTGEHGDVARRAAELADAMLDEYAVRCTGVTEGAARQAWDEWGANSFADELCRVFNFAAVPAGQNRQLWELYKGGCSVADVPCWQLDDDGTIGFNLQHAAFAVTEDTIKGHSVKVIQP